MAKWTSVLFSDVRNKLGNQVVFSVWKGRGYMRKYLKPANPQTAKQMANRDVMAKLVNEWKANKKGDADAEAVWNAYGLEQGNISGYNLFVKFGRLCKISCPPTASGQSSATVTITYDATALGADAIILAFTPGDTIQEIELSAPAGTINFTATVTGKYEFWIASRRIMDGYPGAGDPPLIARITKWTPDLVEGVAKAAECNVTIS